MGQHRAGKLKQVNKKHKTPGGTRPSRENAVSGRVSKKNAQTNNKVAMGKQERLNRQKQLMQEKRMQSIREKRRSSPQDGKIIGVIPLTSDFSWIKLYDVLTAGGNDSDWVSNTPKDNIQNKMDLYNKSQKQHFSFIAPALSEYQYDPMNIIEVLAVCNSLLLLVDCDESDMSHPLIDDGGLKLLHLLVSYGSPGITIAFLANPSSSSRFNFKNPPKSWKSEYEHFQVSLATYFQSDNHSYKLLALNQHDNQLARLLLDNIKINRWRNQRSYLTSDQVEITSDNNNLQLSDMSDEELAQTKCKVTIRGILGGAPMSVHSLVHIMGVGVGRIARIKKLNMHGGSEEGEMVVADSEKQDRIEDLEAEADILQGEQTWPDDSEMPHDDEEEDKNSEEGDSDSEGASLDGSDNENEEEDPEKVYQSFFNRKQLKIEKKNKNDNDDGQDEDEEDQMDAGEEEELDMDEIEERGDFVDTPIDMSARQRFARYRALQSFRSSPWHPKENLPQQYAKVYEFEDMKGIQKRLVHTIEDASRVQLESVFNVNKAQSKATKARSNSAGEGEMMVEDDVPQISGSSSNFYLDENQDYIRSDQFVEIEIEDVSIQVRQQLEDRGYLSIFALHSYEYKLSVLHFNIKRVHGSTEIIKSKDELIFQTGFRSFVTKAIFSESNLNCDKHKFFRYLPMEGFSVASCIGPVLMTPSCPLLIFKRSSIDGSLSLVATGSWSTIDPDRIVLKKIILSGKPIRVRKRTGVVKHMFHDPMDVKYFKPAELTTKMGLRGHIKESVGTHGLFKAQFSALIKQNDNVMLVLYKRVFPKIPDNGLEIQ